MIAPRRRRPVVPYVRHEVFARWGSACGYCGTPAVALDHIRPLSRGGADVLRNVMPACEPCNTSKGAQTLAEWAGASSPPSLVPTASPERHTP